METPDDFNDNLPELDGTPAPATSRPASRPQKALLDPAAQIGLGVAASRQIERNQVRMFPCPHCQGTGRFVRGFISVRDYGPCNKCHGTGKVKTDPAKSRARNEARRVAKANKLQAEQVAWRETHPAEAAWIDTHSQRFDFARSMLQALQQYGSLTDNQLGAIQRCITKDKEREQARATREAAAPTVQGAGFMRMLAAFVAAKTSGLKNPKFRVGEYAFKPAKPDSRNAGCIYVTRGETYLGRISPENRFVTVRDCTKDDEAHVLDICKDPFAAAMLHGQQTGRCSCCGAELTNKESIELGIGPICRSKWGL